MDQQVICSSKEKYRTKVVQKMIDAIDSNKTLQNVSIIEVMKMPVLTWAEVNPKSVKNCLRKQVFLKLKTILECMYLMIRLMH